MTIKVGKKCYCQAELGLALKGKACQGNDLFRQVFGLLQKLLLAVLFAFTQKASSAEAYSEVLLI